MTSPHDDVPQTPTWAAPAGSTPPPPPPGRAGLRPAPPPRLGHAAAPRRVRRLGTRRARRPPVSSWRPPALQPGIIPLRPLGMGEIYDGAFRAVRANPRVMFGLAALVVTLAVTLQSVIQWYVKGIAAGQLADLSTDVDPSGQMGFADQLGSSFGLLVGAPVTAIATTVLTGLLIVSVSRSVLGQVAQRRRGAALVAGLARRRLHVPHRARVGASCFGALVTAVVLLAVNDQVALAVVVGLLSLLAARASSASGTPRGPCWSRPP